MSWTYIDDGGELHRIGLFHGEANRHLLVYCDQRVLIIDFNVHASKNYSFYINDELLDIEVEEKDGRFAYGLKVDEKTDTPRNRARQRALRRERILLAVIGLGLVALVAAAVWVLRL